MTPLAFDTTTVWLNAAHKRNIDDVLASAADVVNVSACAPLLVGLPLLNTVHPENMFVIVVTPVMLPHVTVWLNATHERNIDDVLVSAALDVVKERGRVPRFVRLPLLNRVHPENMDERVVTPLMSDTMTVWLNAGQLENMAPVVVRKADVVNVRGDVPAFVGFPLLNTVQLENMLAMVVTRVVFDTTTA